MACQHEKVYIESFEKGRVLWICRLCQASGGELDNGDPKRIFDHEEYFRLLNDFNDRARERARARRTA